MGFGWSFSMGRWLGVEVRLHWYFVFLVGLAVGWAGILQGNPMRGILLWALVLGAVGVREAARGVAAAWFGLEVKSLLLLPSGGLAAYESAESTKRAGEPEVQWGLALAGTLASVVFGLTVLGLALAIVPGLDVLSGPWISPRRLVKALVWANILLGALQLFPAWPTDAGRVLQGELQRRAGLAGLATYARLGPALVLGMISFGAVRLDWWLVAMGISVMIAARLERQGLLASGGSNAVKVRDVMLTEYSVLSASATLEDAIMQARHTLQDVFPVVRSGNMVGAVGRGEILTALERGGNGYVQGIMAREFRTAMPGDSLVETLGRVTGGERVSSQIVPVVEGERIVGIITPQNLSRSMGLLMRKASAPGSRAALEDERD